jgi:putative transposase
MVHAIFETMRGKYGSPRILKALRQVGVHVSRKRVARLMREMGLRARSAKLYRRRKGTRKFFSGIPNATLNLTTTATNQVWVGDVTYIRIGSSWRYLAVVMDRHSRRILGWSLAANRDLPLTQKALTQALRRKRHHQGLIFHSDRGVEYAAYDYRSRLTRLGITQSMKRPKEIGDNAFIESFFHSMKADVIHGTTFEHENDLRGVISSYMRFYNKTRLHSSLGYRSPIDYESETVQT